MELDEDKDKIKQANKKASIFNRRLFIAMLIIFTLAAVLILRLCYLQIIEQGTYISLSQQNQLTLLPIPPNRGTIYDRNGIVIAENLPVFSLEIIPDKVKDIPKTITELKQFIDISPEDIEQFNKQVKQHRRFDAVPLKLKLTDEEIARFYANQYLFPGVFIKAQLMRYYPLGPTFADVVGYVGRINEKELGEINQSNYAATNFIGKLGIEAQYEDQLHGEVGYQEVETDANGRIVRVLKRIPPTPGEDLYLSVDSRLQIAAEKALGDEFGAVVVIQPSTGEILAMASRPNFDPNVFVKGMSTAEYQALQNAPGRPLFNRSLRGQYPFGSTIKPFLALEGLNSGVIDDKFKIRDPGYFNLPGASHTYRDWKKGGHGTVDVSKAVTISCDTFFYTIGVKMGISHIKAILNDFGFGHLTGVDLGEELPGLVPSPQWKKRIKGQTWYPGDTVVSAIGQGYMLTTPLQLANGTAILSMRGHGYRPHFLIKWRDANGHMHDNPPVPLPPVNVDPKYWDIVIAAMRNVVLPGGTAAAFGQTPYTVAGKTGTAQVFSTHGRGQSKNLPKHLRDNTLFIAFAPVDKPQIAVATIVENSKLAKQVSRKVFDAYFKEEDKDKDEAKSSDSAQSAN